jgi:HMG (high mobility group) box
MQSYQDEFYQSHSPKLQTSILEDGNQDTPHFGRLDKDFSHTFQTSYVPAKHTENSNETVLSQIKRERSPIPHRRASPTSKSLSLTRLQTSPVRKSQIGVLFHQELPSEFSFSDVSPNDFPLSGLASAISSPIGFEGSSNSKSKKEKPRSHTPRPSNSFILYRREKHVELMAQYKGQKSLSNNVISKIVASMWRSETPEVKAHFASLAEQEKRAHLLKYPDYKYKPRKSSKKSPTSVSKKSPPAREKSNREEIPSAHHEHYHQTPWNMVPPLHHYQAVPMHGMNMHRMPLMAPTEVERGFEMMNSDRIGNAFETEFVSQDGALQSPEYGHSWPLSGSVHGVWDMGLGRTLEGRPE